MKNKKTKKDTEIDAVVSGLELARLTNKTVIIGNNVCLPSTRTGNDLLRGLQQMVEERKEFDRKLEEEMKNRNISFFK